MKILLLNDGNRGNFVQSYGIAKEFFLSQLEILKVNLKGPVYKLPGRKGKYPLLSKFLNIFCLLSLFKYGEKLLVLLMREKINLKEKYDFIISAGSILAPVNVILSKSYGAKSIQIMVPSGIPLRLFDFVIIPYHDFIRMKFKRKKNFIITLGAPNHISKEVLEEGKKKLLKQIGEVDRKIIGVLIGGDDQNYRISLEWIEKLVYIMKKLKKEYFFLITTSKRTDRKVVEFLEKSIKFWNEVKYLEIPGRIEISHYAGILGLSDILLVTEDSINMISEAVTTGRRVIVLGVERKVKKKLVFDYTIEQFVKNGYVEYIKLSEIERLKEKIERDGKKERKILNEAKECVQKILGSLT